MRIREGLKTTILQFDRDRLLRQDLSTYAGEKIDQKTNKESKERRYQLNRLSLNHLQANGYAVNPSSPSNANNPEVFKGIIEALNTIAEDIEIIFPAYPRTKEFQIYPDNDNFRITDPLSYRDLLRLYKNLRFVLPDSNNIQQGIFYHTIPCFPILNFL